MWAIRKTDRFRGVRTDEPASRITPYRPTFRFGQHYSSLVGIDRQISATGRCTFTHWDDGRYLDLMTLIRVGERRGIRTAEDSLLAKAVRGRIYLVIAQTKDDERKGRREGGGTIKIIIRLD
jgi:hypothetical protein